MLKVGDKLPEFEGLNQDGEAINSSKLIGKKTCRVLLPASQHPYLHCGSM